MTCASVTIRLGRWMHVKLIRQSVTYVSGTFVTLDTGLNTKEGAEERQFFIKAEVLQDKASKVEA